MPFRSPPPACISHSGTAATTPLPGSTADAGSFALGFLVLGPVDGFAIGDSPSFGDGSEIVVRLLVGNTILAVLVTVLAYLIVYRLVVAYQRNSLPVLEETIEEMVDELETQLDADQSTPPDDSAD